MSSIQMQNKETYKLWKNSQINKTVSSLVGTCFPESASKQKQIKKTENSVLVRQKILAVSSHKFVCDKKWKYSLASIHLEPTGRLA